LLQTNAQGSAVVTDEFVRVVRGVMNAISTLMKRELGYDQLDAGSITTDLVKAICDAANGFSAIMDSSPDSLQKSIVEFESRLDSMTNVLDGSQTVLVHLCKLGLNACTTLLSKQADICMTAILTACPILLSKQADLRGDLF
jgi:hypothetical protein